MNKNNSPKVLIVEDTEAISKALLLKLSDENIEIKAASTGQEAINLISKNLFDVILLDLVIPDIDGFSILEALRNKKSKAKIIILSNLAQKEDIEKAKTYGVKDYFVKSDTSISSVVEYTKNYLKDAN